MKTRQIILLLMLIPFVWMWANYGTLNPFAIKGPDFLRFYPFLLAMVYVNEMVQIQWGFSKSNNNLNWWNGNGFLFIAFLLGVARLVRGVYLGRPVGYLLLILIAESFLSIIVASKKRHDLA